MNFDDPYIVTASGKRFHILNPRSGEISFHDIAFALSNMCRFTGHVDFYSVAQHSILVKDLVESRGGTPMEQRWGLLHDAAEAYVSDLNSPVKSTWGLASYREVEHRVLREIAKTFGLCPDYPPDIVMDMDRLALRIEVVRFFPREIAEEDFGIRDRDKPSDTDMVRLYGNVDIDSVRTRFHREYDNLRRKAINWTSGESR